MNVDHVNTVPVMDTPTRQTKTLEFGVEKGAGVQPQQDPGGTLRMNGVSERQKTRETSLDRAKSARERERETRRGVQSLALVFYLP